MSEDQRGLVSSVLNHLNPQLPAVPPTFSQLRRVEADSSMTGTANRRKSEIDAVARGLYNFAPIANITSTNHTSRPAEALVQNAPFFPRTKVRYILIALIVKLGTNCRTFKMIIFGSVLSYL